MSPWGLLKVGPLFPTLQNTANEISLYLIFHWDQKVMVIAKGERLRLR